MTTLEILRLDSASSIKNSPSHNSNLNKRSSQYNGSNGNSKGMCIFTFKSNPSIITLEEKEKPLQFVLKCVLIP